MSDVVAELAFVCILIVNHHDIRCLEILSISCIDTDIIKIMFLMLKSTITYLFLL